MTSTAYIEYHWAEPDPDIIAQRLISIANSLEDFTEPMTIAGQLARVDTAERFQTGTDPSGTPWAPWSENYQPYALAHSQGPIFGGSANLQLTGGMKDAATSPAAYVPTDAGLFIDTSGFPEHWAWNNFGSYDRERASRGEDQFGVIGGGDNPLPERPFIGLSAAARAKIDAIFFAWVEGEISIVLGGRGSKLRGPGGRFVKMP